MMIIVFTTSMLVSATLLFLVEPMIAKMLLPMLGGTPAVWNTCLVFFQGMLLIGYLYAHGAIKWLGRRTQIALHVVLVLLPLLLVGMLPLHLLAGWEPPTESSPVFWLLAMLVISVGLPFFALSSSTPILQHWFADSEHRRASDPYFLYAASNTGSLAGLLAYPLLLEPLQRLSDQSHLWRYGYMLFAGMTITCASLVWGSRSENAAAAADETQQLVETGGWRERFRWLALAFVPSSLMIGVTTALTTDVPAIPLFWVLPLSLYLISFVLVFAKRPLISHNWMIRRLPLIILVALIPIVSQMRCPVAVLLALYLLVLFAVAMVCHGELARSRPRISRLTEFYLWISVGGVLGGIFNALLAPLIFRTVLELPLALIGAALLRPPIDVKPLTGTLARAARQKDVLLPVALGLSMTAVILMAARMGIKPSRPLNILLFGYSMLWCLSFGKRPFRFAAGVAAILLASSLYTGSFGRILYTERSFFGVSRVTNDTNARFRYLFHGGTIHGIESLDDNLSREPLTYYTQSGPAGAIFRSGETSMPNGDVAIIGLGAGTMACLLGTGQSLTYYEIDPSIVGIARNPSYFKYLQQCAPHASIVLGDARLKLADAPDGNYGLIVLDAFSGDAIPMHLMTKEALELYLHKLAPGGLIAFHVSNLYLKLGPTLGNLARNAHLVALTKEDTVVSQKQIDGGKFPSVWVVMARSQADLAGLTADRNSSARWVPVEVQPGLKLWTDDYSNLLSLIKWYWD